MRGLPK